MNSKLFFLLGTLFLFATCAEQKSLTPLPDDGTSIFYDQGKKPFYHGVASGDPLSTSVIIWTKGYT